MENRLKCLKNKRVSRNLEFTDKHKDNILKALQFEKYNDENILIAVLQLLKTKKTGFELMQLLIVRGIKQFDKNEGALYLLLHDLEYKGYIISEWNQEADKYYFLHRKGKQLLKQYANQREKHVGLSERLRSDLSYE